MSGWQSDSARFRRRQNPKHGQIEGRWGPNGEWVIEEWDAYEENMEGGRGAWILVDVVRSKPRSRISWPIIRVILLVILCILVIWGTQGLYGEQVTP